MEPYFCVPGSNDEGLSETLGPPGYFPLLPTRPEEHLDPQSIVHGYKEVSDSIGITEVDESTLSLLHPPASIQPAPADAVLQTLLRSLKRHRKDVTASNSHTSQAGAGHASALQPAQPAVNGKQLLAWSNTQPCLPPTRSASDEEVLAWLYELAGNHDLVLLARNVPESPNKNALLKGLWQARVPVQRAAWYIRILQLGSHLKSGQHGSGHGTNNSMAGRGGPEDTQQVGAATKGKTSMGRTKSLPLASPGAVATAGLQGTQAAASSPYMLGVTPEVAASCAEAWTSMMLDHLDACIAAATAAMSGQAVPASSAIPAAAPTPLTPYTELPTSPAPGFDFLADPGSVSGLQAMTGSLQQPQLPSMGSGGVQLGRGAAAVPGAAAAGLNAMSLANEVLAASAAELLDQGVFAMVHYYVGLASHTFKEGLSSPLLVLDWAQRIVGSSAAGALKPMPVSWSEPDLYRAALVLPVLHACVQDLVTCSGAAKRLVTFLLDMVASWQQFEQTCQPNPSSSAPHVEHLLHTWGDGGGITWQDSTSSAALPSKPHRVTADAMCDYSITQLRLQACSTLQHVLHACPSTVLMLESLPQLLAEVAWAQLHHLVSEQQSLCSPAALPSLSLALDELPYDPEQLAVVLQVMLGNQGCPAAPAAGASQMAHRSRSMEHHQHTCPIVPQHPGLGASAAACLNFVEAVVAYEQCTSKGGTTLSGVLAPPLPTSTTADMPYLNVSGATRTGAAKDCIGDGGCVKNRQLDSDCGPALGLAENAQHGLTALTRIAGRAQALEAAVHPKVLSFSEGAAMQRMQAALARGDVETAYGQLVSCMGKEGLRNADAAVALACNFAVANPLELPSDFTARLLQPGCASLSSASTLITEPLSLPPSPRIMFCVCLLVRLHSDLHDWITAHARAATPTSTGLQQPLPSVQHRMRASSPAPAAATHTTMDVARSPPSGLYSMAPAYTLLSAVSAGQGLLQHSLHAWVDSAALTMPCTCQAGQSPSACLQHAQQQQSATMPTDLTAAIHLLLTLERAGLWSSQQYASSLLSEGKMTAGLTAPTNLQDAAVGGTQQNCDGHNPPVAALLSTPHAWRAAKHWVVLKLLHPAAVAACSSWANQKSTMHTMHASTDTESAAPVHDYQNSTQHSRSSLTYRAQRRTLLSSCPGLTQLRLPQSWHVSNDATGKGAASRTELQEPTGALNLGVGVQDALATAAILLEQARVKEDPQPDTLGLAQYGSGELRRESIGGAGSTYGIELRGPAALALPATLASLLAWLHNHQPAAQQAFAVSLWRIVLQQLAGAGMVLADVTDHTWAGAVRSSIQASQATCASVATAALFASPQPGHDVSHPDEGVMQVATPELTESRGVSMGPAVHETATGPQGSKKAFEVMTSAGEMDVDHAPAKSQRLTDLWLSRVVTLLDAAGASDLAVSLLLSMLRQHAQHAQRTVAEEFCAAGSSFPGTGFTHVPSLTDMGLTTHTVLSWLLAMMDRVVAMGALPELAETCCAATLLPTSPLPTPPGSMSTSMASPTPLPTRLLVVADQLLGSCLDIVSALLAMHLTPAQKETLVSNSNPAAGATGSNVAAGGSITTRTSLGGGPGVEGPAHRLPSSVTWPAAAGWCSTRPSWPMVACALKQARLHQWLAAYLERLSQQPQQWQDWVRGMLRNRLNDVASQRSSGNDIDHPFGLAPPPLSALNCPSKLSALQRLVGSIKGQVQQPTSRQGSHANSPALTPPQKVLPPSLQPVPGSQLQRLYQQLSTAVESVCQHILQQAHAIQPGSTMFGQTLAGQAQHEEGEVRIVPDRQQLGSVAVEFAQWVSSLQANSRQGSLGGSAMTEPPPTLSQQQEEGVALVCTAVLLQWLETASELQGIWQQHGLQSESWHPLHAAFQQASQQLFTALMDVLNQFEVNLRLTQVSASVQRGLLVAAAALLMQSEHAMSPKAGQGAQPGSTKSAPARDVHSSDDGSTQPTAAFSQLATFMAMASCNGMLFYRDVAQGVLSLMQNAHPALLQRWRYAVMGPSMLTQLFQAQSAAAHIRAPLDASGVGNSGPSVASSDSGALGTLKSASLCLLNVGTQYAVHHFQCALDAHTVFTFISQPLLVVTSSMCRRTTAGSSAAAARASNALQLMQHVPIRQLLLQDPMWLHSQLRSSSCLAAAASVLVSAAETDGQLSASNQASAAPSSSMSVSSSYAHLPLLMALVVLQAGPGLQSNEAGRSSPNSAVGRAERGAHDGAPDAQDWETEFASLVPRLLAGTRASNSCLVSVVLRLLVDERKALDALQEDSRRPVREVLDASHGPLPPLAGQAMGSKADAAAAGKAGPNKSGAPPQPGWHAGSASQAAPSAAAASAAGALGNPGMGGTAPPPLEASTAEKLLCNCMLTQLLDAPQSAALLAHMSWQLGTSVGSWLLRSTGWLLEDRQEMQLTGLTSITQVLTRLRSSRSKGRAAAREPAQPGVTGAVISAAGINGSLQAHADKPPLHPSTHAAAATGSAAVGGVAASRASSSGKAPDAVRNALSSATCLASVQAHAQAQAAQAPWALESGLITMTVVSLSHARSQLKPFAAELVRQLGRIVDILKRATAAAATFTPAPQLTSVGMDSTAAAAGGTSSLHERKLSASAPGEPLHADSPTDIRAGAKRARLSSGAGAQAGAGHSTPPPIAIPGNSAGFDTSGADGGNDEATEMELCSPSSSVSAMRVGQAADDEGDGAASHARLACVSSTSSLPLPKTYSADYSQQAADTPKEAQQAAAGVDAAHRDGAVTSNEAATAGTAGKKRSFGQGRFGRGGAGLRLGSGSHGGTTPGSHAAGDAAGSRPAAAGPQAKVPGQPATAAGVGSMSSKVAVGVASITMELDGAAPEAGGAAGSSVVLGPAEAVQAAVWLRLSLLLPLLPVVYTDKELDAKRNLRMSLVPTLLQLLASPVIQHEQLQQGVPSTATGSTSGGIAAPAGHHGQGSHLLIAVLRQQHSSQVPRYAYLSHACGQAVAQASCEAQEGLWDRLHHVMAAMMAGTDPTWPAWLKGSQSKKLKEVAAYPVAATEQLAQELEKCDRAVRLATAAMSKLMATLPQQSTAHGMNVAMSDPGAPAGAALAAAKHMATADDVGVASGAAAAAASPCMLAHARHPALPALMALTPLSSLLPWAFEPAKGNNIMLGSGYKSTNGTLMSMPGSALGNPSPLFCARGNPATIKSSLASQLHTEFQPQYIELPQLLLQMACGPSLARSGPWGMHSTARQAWQALLAAMDSTENVSAEQWQAPMARTLQTCIAGLLQPGPGIVQGSYPPQQPQVGSGQHALTDMAASAGTPGNTAGEEAADAVSCGGDAVLVSCWVPTPAESLLPWRHGQL